MRWEEAVISRYQARYRNQSLDLALELEIERETLSELNDPDSGADFAEISDQEHLVEALQRLVRKDSDETPIC